MADKTPVFICGGVALVLLITGVALVVVGNQQGAALAKVDHEAEFQALGPICTITDVQHTFSTKRRTESCGSDCGKKVEFCEDRVTYSFTMQGNTTQYTDRVYVSERGYADVGIEIIPSIQDRCNGAAGYTQDVVCEGRVCRVGEKVKCWRPITECAPDCKTAHPWADCANDVCAKVISPATEMGQAEEDASILGLLGILCLILGGGASIFSCIIFYCFMRPRGPRMPQ